MVIYPNPKLQKSPRQPYPSGQLRLLRDAYLQLPKVGESNFVKMYNERIIDGTVDFSQYHGAIFCPGCNERIATRYMTKMDKKEAYRLVPSAFHKKKVRL